MLAKEWFGEMLERHKLISDFNRAANKTSTTISTSKA